MEGGGTMHDPTVPIMKGPKHVDHLVSQCVKALLEHSQGEWEDCKMSLRGSTVENIDSSIN